MHKNKGVKLLPRLSPSICAMKLNINFRDEGAEYTPMTWRLSPEKTLADWTIFVKTKNSTEPPPVQYHCHRVSLAVGPKACGFFTKEFIGHDEGKIAVEVSVCNEADAPLALKKRLVPKGLKKAIQQLSRTASAAEGVPEASCLLSTELVLESRAAEVFPALLDYLYCSTDALEISSSSAVALLDLSLMLRCKKAFLVVKNFIEADLSIQTSPSYIIESSMFPSASLVFSAAVELCASNFEKVDESSLLNLSQDLLLQVVDSPSLSVSSWTFCKRVVAYLNRHVGSVTGELVSALTRSGIMSDIDPSVGLDLLRFSYMHGVAECGSTPANKSSSNAALRERCVRAIKSDYRSAMSSRDFSGIPADIVVDLLKGPLRAQLV